ncbi:MAG: hypothetical protein JWQ98_1713 [Chlorobi bacterium]|nr:hypothetical protein [Chlorobiota bacterium]
MKPSMGGQLRHQLARHAAATLLAEIRNLASDGPSNAIRHDLRSAAELVVSVVERACDGPIHRKPSPFAGAVRVALARLEANMLVAGTCGELTVPQAMMLEPMLNYLLGYCGVVGEMRPAGRVASRADA